MKNYRTCPDCDGNGSRQTEPPFCDCLECNGTGQIEVKTRICPDCDGLGSYRIEEYGEYFECEGCKGTGELNADF